jgi:hypothetical protein
MFKCPQCSFDTQSAKGWKLHLSKTHSGWTDEMWAKAAAEGSAQAGAVSTGYKDLQEAAAAAPETDQPAEEKPAGESGKKARRAAPLDREMTARIDEMRSKFFEALAKWSCDFIERATPGEEITEKDRALVKEGFEFPAKCLNIQFAIEPLNWQLTSLIWTFIMPIIAIAITVIPRLKFHAEPSDEQDRGNHSAEGDRQDAPGGANDKGA